MGELNRLLEQIRALTAEVGELKRRGVPATAVEARERVLEELRWRLAAVARRSVAGGLPGAS
jgi:hypothetical protein